jgi:formylglycine-generating enzyme
MKKIAITILTVSAVFCFSILPLGAEQLNVPKDGLPVNVMISYCDSTVSINWDEVTNRLQYYIYSQDDPYSEFTLIDSTTSTTWNGNYAQNKKFFYVTAEVNSGPEGFVCVQGGTFLMGDGLSEGNTNELPVHSVTLSTFYMGKYEVTQAEWSQYMPGVWNYYGTGYNFPAYDLTWYEMVKYCNLRSLAEGLTPCYTINSSTNPADWGIVPYHNLIIGGIVGDQEAWDSAICNWSANGYRLPTEAEWEYAARGGVHSSDNLRYSGCNIEADLINYAWYSENSGYSTHPVGTKLPNQLGLYDMAGNMNEWVWDFYGPYTSDEQTNPKGPATGSYRIVRDCYFRLPAEFFRVAIRSYGPVINTAGISDDSDGFRLARTP